MRDNCELGIVEDIRHVFLQCPNSNDEVCSMYKELYAIEDGSGTRAIESCNDIVYLILGGHVESLSQ